MHSAVIPFATILTSPGGDDRVKIASRTPHGRFIPSFLFGALGCGLPAVGWLHPVPGHSLVIVTVLHSAETVLRLGRRAIW